MSYNDSKTCHRGVRRLTRVPEELAQLLAKLIVRGLEGLGLT